MNIHWNKCDGDIWCELYGVNLNHNHFNHMTGVYVIWHGGPSPRTVRVGQGFIRDRLKAHRQDPQIQRYQSLGLYVTWTTIRSDLLNGVEAYLAEALGPIVGEQFPNVPLIQVNLPW